MNMQQLQDIINDLDSRTSLELSGQSLDDAKVTILAEALKKNTTITSLNLSKNNIKYKGVNSAALSGALQKNCTLESLNLNDNKLDQDNLDGRSVKSISRALEKNKTLTFIGLSNNAINEISARALGVALDMNESLTAIDLSNNNLQGKSAQHIIHGIFQHADFFKTIDLSNNGFDAVNAWEIANIFEKNETLTYLNLNNNDLEQSDTIALTLINDVIQRNITSSQNKQMISSETPSLIKITENIEKSRENNKKRKFSATNENIITKESNKKLKLDGQEKNETPKIYQTGSKAMMYSSNNNNFNQKDLDEKRAIVNHQQRRFSI